MLAVAPFSWDTVDVVAISLIATAIMQMMIFVTIILLMDKDPNSMDFVICQSAALLKDAAQ